MGDMQRLRQLCWAVLGARTNRKGDRRSCQLKPRRIAYAATVSPARDARSCPLACTQGRAPRPDTTVVSGRCHNADQTQDRASPRQTSASRRVLQAAHSLPHSAAPPAPRLPRAAGCSRPAARTAPHPGTPRPACPAPPPRHGIHPRCWPPHQTLRRFRAQRCPPPPQRTPHLLKHVLALTHRAQTPFAYFVCHQRVASETALTVMVPPTPLVQGPTGCCGVKQCLGLPSQALAASPHATYCRP